MSQGEIVFLDSKRFLAENSGEKLLHHKIKRIVMQGITGVNEKVRLKMTIAENAFCANSVNYLIFKQDKNIELNFMLGLFNSNLMNYVFSKFSTNSNVNGYEVDNLPIAMQISKTLQIKIKTIVEEVLALINSANYLNSKAKQIKVYDLEKQIDQRVYDLYGLTEKEIALVEKTLK